VPTLGGGIPDFGVCAQAEAGIDMFRTRDE